MAEPAPADRSVDAALVAAFGRGDSAAEATVVRRYQRRVYGLALSITREPKLAAEVAQTAFVRARGAAAAFDARRVSVDAWLLTITRRIAVSIVRTRSEQSTSDPAPALEEVVAQSLRSSASDPAGGRGEAVAGLRQLSATHPLEARAVALAVIAGCSVQQVSAYEGVSMATAHSRIGGGLRRLHALPQNVE